MCPSPAVTHYDSTGPALSGIVLEAADPADLPDFSQRLQASFLVAIEREFGPWNGGPVPSDSELLKSYTAEGAEVLHIVHDGERVGGAVISIDASRRRGSLDLLFVSPDVHGMGVGTATWNAIESAHPEVEMWETVTPYFERRNIHFYINKCGFHAVEFFNERHGDPDMAAVDDDGTPIPGCDMFLRFEKRRSWER